jgi:hypothetical protein
VARLGMLQRRDLVAGGESPSRLGADGASGGRRRKCRASGGWGYGRLRIAATAVGDWEEVRRRAKRTDAAAGDGDAAAGDGVPRARGGGRWGSRVRY